MTKNIKGEKEEFLDAIIVGGGMAGLTAAYHLRDQRIILLEKENRLGGRMFSEEWKGCHYNLGAQFTVGEKTFAAQFANELNVKRSSPEKELAIYFHGQLCRGGPLKIFRDLPISFRAKLSLLRSGLVFGSRIKEINKDVELLTNGKNVKSKMDNIYFSETLKSFHSDVGKLYTTLFNSFVPVEPDQLSTLFAIHFLFSSSDSNPTLVHGGMETIVKAWQQKMFCNWLTGAEVSLITLLTKGVRVIFRHEGKTKNLLAKVCIVAVPSSSAAKIIPSLPTDQKTALAEIEYGGYLVVAVFLKERISDQISMMFVEGKIFSMLVNPNIMAARNNKSGKHSVLVLYAGDKQTKQLADLADSDIIEYFVKDLLIIFPYLKGKITGGRVQRWKLGQPIWEPGHLARLSVVCRPFADSIYFCGDYSDFSGLSGAIASGIRASNEVKLKLYVNRP